MTGVPSVLCPIDFSAASRTALVQGAFIANHFGATLTALTVADPLVAAVAASDPTEASIEADTEQALRRFCRDALARMPAGPLTVLQRVAVGPPAQEIVREAEASHADLIVMSSRGQRGFRKLLFGSTTERVLRNTTVPVLITPGTLLNAYPLSELAGHIHEVVAPVDMTTATRRQITIAAAIADSLDVPLMLTHVIETARGELDTTWAIAGPSSPLRQVQREIQAIQNSIGPRVRTESLIVSGEPAEEIVEIAASRDAKLIVMGLHSAGVLGPKMGSVTYRVLSKTDAFVLALPPQPAASRYARSA